LFWHINNVTPDAKEPIKAAREEATHAWAEQALDIGRLPRPLKSTRLDTGWARRCLAAILNREEFSDKQQHEVALDLCALHIAALRARTVPTTAASAGRNSFGHNCSATLGSGKAQKE
jgi:hypothetical protein